MSWFGPRTTTLLLVIGGLTVGLITPVTSAAATPAMAAAAARTATPADLPPGAPDGGPPLPDAPPAIPTGALHTWTAQPSDVAGGIVRAAGEIVVTDTSFDDYGADLQPNEDPTDAVNGSDQCGTPVPCFGQGGNAKDGYLPSLTGGPEGEYTYPEQDEIYARNAADLVETRLAADEDAWYVLVRLNTLLDPTRTAVSIQVDGRELLVHGATASFEGKPVTAVADKTQAHYEVRVPRTVHDLTGVQDVFAAAGLWDPEVGDWQRPEAGRSPYFDLLYVPREPMTSYWRDAAQSADIAAEDFAEDTFSVDTDALAAGTCPAGLSCPAFDGPTSGLFSRVFRSGQDLGPGVAFQDRLGQDSGAFTRNVYRAPTQPYAVYVPKNPTGAMVMLIHHLGGSYMAYSITAMPGLAQWAEELGVTVLMPEGRGEGGWYEGEAEKDVFEVWRDAATHYDLDRERVFLAGMSMGGYGTWRLSQLYPDQFSRSIVWAGLLTAGEIDLQTLFGNSRNVPLYVVHGGLDPLVPATGPEEWMPDYGRRGNGTYRYRFYPDRSHETTFPGANADLVAQWYEGLPARQTNPVRVTYKVVDAYQQPEFGISYDGAYWVDDMVLAPGADSGTVEASRSTEPDTVEVLPVTPGADLLGPFRLTGSDVTPPPAEPNRVDLQLDGLSALSLDTVTMGWTPATQRVTTSSDRATEVTLNGAYGPGTRVVGAPGDVDADRVTLRLPAGENDVTIVPAGTSAPAAAPGATGPATRPSGAGPTGDVASAGRVSLPATGAPALALPALLTVLAGLALRRRRHQLAEADGPVFRAD